MPKIFLIKDRLMQQQQWLSLTKDEDRQAEAKSREILIGGGEHSKPLSLVKKGQEKAESDDERQQSRVETGKEPPDRGPPRRFVSALGGGNVPYGSHGHVLTCAQRKEYSLPPQIQATLLQLKSPDERVKLPETPKPKVDDKPKPKNLLGAAPVRNFSVIKRAPTSKQDEDKDTRLPPLVPPQQEPEQDQPIDYHIPKRKGETEDENEERKLREQRRSQCNKICKPVLLPGGRRVGKMPVMMSAAAGHGRGSANAGGQGGSSQPSSTSGGGGTINFSTGGSSGGVSGGMGGGTGGGGPGRDGRQNYGPSSPPSGSLPPFYESLKSGNNGGNTFNANSFASNYLSMNNMDCEAGHQELANLNLGGGGVGGGGGNVSPPRSYSTLQNANYGLIMKDENSLDFYESKGGEGGMSLLTGNGNYCYDEAMMVEIDGNLQFNTAGLNFGTASGNDLLESLTDSTDLSTFLTKIPGDGGVENELNSDNNGQIGQQVDSDLEFSDQIILNSRSFDSRNGYGTKFSNLYSEALPSYTPPNEALQRMFPPPPQPFCAPQHHHNLEQHHHNLEQHHQHHQRHDHAAFSVINGNGNNDSSHLDVNKLHQQVQLNQQPNQMLSPSLSFSGSVGTLDLDSPTTMSLPSPSGTTMCSSDNNDRGSLSPPTTTGGTGNVSDRRSSTSSSEAVAPVLKTRATTNVLHGRLGLSADYQLEFVNGGAGVKNPMASQEPTRHGPRTEDKTKVASITTEDGQTNFCCRQCNKTFALQRLLNRHMKCHSDVKRYLCTFCGKGFNDTFDLKRHTRTHTGVRPYKCQLCEKSFTQRCSLESHCLKVHGVQHQYAYKERRTKMYVCEECGHTTSEPEVHYIHLKEKHPYSPALLKFYDKRHFKFTNSNFANMLLQDNPLTVDSQTMPGPQYNL